ncbi:MAG: lipid A deacylase LpxR family protein [Bacteroidetes bacterium]|nr:lipid A deacylase LpxR family protein [Bacteroidota bacterium]
MGRILLFTVFLLGIGQLYAQEVQETDTLTHLFRIYEDDDCINILGNFSDNAYTNGTRLDYFYMPARTPRFFVDHILPHAGNSSRNIYGWGITQLMYTPDDLLKTTYQPNDYPYSGALFATHTLYSYNKEKKYSLQTELVLGMIGPASFAKQTQRFVHRIEGFDIPMGWDHQFSNDVLFNINFAAEKELTHVGNGLEVIGGSRAFLGTMQNGLALYPLIRFGGMTPYFNGFISQYASTTRNKEGDRKGQFYFFIKPEVQLVLTNAMVQGGIFTKNPNLNSDEEKVSVNGQVPAPPPALPYPDLNKLYASISYGAVFTINNFGLSFSQSSSSAQLKGLYCHQTGNVSLHFSW